MSQVKKDDENKDETIKRITRLETSLKKKETELMLLHGRIKGYETLNHLFQELKQQYNHQKEHSDKLQEQLTSLSHTHSERDQSTGKHVTSSEDILKQGNAQGGSQTADNILQTPAAGIGTSSMHGTQVAIKPEKSPPEAERKEVMVPEKITYGLDDSSLASSSSDYDSFMFDPYAPLLPAKGKDKTKTKGIGNRAFLDMPNYDTRIKEKPSPGSEKDVSLSFPSLPQKSGLSTPPKVGDSPDVLRESTGDTDDTALTMEDPNNVYLHLQQVVAQFEDPTYSSSFISDILHLIPRAMKLDKQARLQQIVIEELRSENNKLRIKTEMKLSSQMQDKSDEKDWVHVEQPSSQADSMTVLTGDNQSFVDVEKHKKLQKHILQISQKKKEIEKEVTHLREENTSLKGKIIEQKQQEQGQASEVEALKKKAEEAEKTNANNLVSLNKKRKTNREFHHLLEESRASEKLAQEQVELLHTTSTAHQKLIDKLKEEISTIKMRCSCQADYFPSVENSLPANPQDIKTELRVLRQQIIIYKEDFERERKDRETAQNCRSSIEQELQEIKREKNQLKQELRRARDKVLDVEAERDRMDALAKKKSDELKSIQQQKRNWEERWNQVRQLSQEPGQETQFARPLEASGPPRRPAKPTNPTIYDRRRPNAMGKSSWPCIHCTFENLPQRIYCEMCGSKASHLRGDFINTHGHLPTMVEQLQLTEGNRQDNYYRHGGNHLVSRGSLECDQAASAQLMDHPDSLLTETQSSQTN